MSKVRLKSKDLFKGNSHVRELGLSWDQAWGPQQKDILYYEPKVKDSDYWAKHPNIPDFIVSLK